MVAAPALRCPRRLGNEDVGHELLEHRAAPTGHDPHAAVGVGALVDLDPEIGADLTHGLHLLPGPVARRGEGPPGGEVVLRRDLTREDAEITRDPGLGHGRVVVVVREPDRIATDVGSLVDAARTVVVEGEETAVHESAGSHGGVGRVGAGVVVRVPAHAAEETACLLGSTPVRARHDEQCGAEPGVVDARAEGVHGVAGAGPGAQGIPGRLVVPVVVHPARLVVLHACERAQRAQDPLGALATGDEAELSRDDRAPQIATDVGGGGVARTALCGRGFGDVVRGEAGAGIRHGVEAAPRVASPAPDGGLVHGCSGGVGQEGGAAL